MKAENKQLLQQLLQQHKDLGISNQIDYDKFYLYLIITHSTAIEGSKMVDKADFVMEMVDKWSIKPTLAEKMVDILLFIRLSHVQIDCVSEVVVRPARAKVHSPGQRPGWVQPTMFALQGQKYKNTGDEEKHFCPYRAHILYIKLPRALPWALDFCPFGACSKAHSHLN